MWKMRIECTRLKFANDITLSGETNILKSRATLQDDLVKLEELANKSLTSLTRSCTWENIIPECSTNRDLPGWEAALWQWGLQVQVKKISESELCTAAVRKAVRMLSCATSRDKEIIIPHYSALVRSPLEYCTQFQPPVQKKYVGRLERVQRRAAKTNTELGCLPPDGRLREQGLLRPGKRRLRGDLITMNQCLKRSYREDGDSILQGVTRKI